MAVPYWPMYVCVGTRCGDASWPNPLYHEGSPQGRPAGHPHFPRHWPEP